MLAPRWCEKPPNFCLLLAWSQQPAVCNPQPALAAHLQKRVPLLHALLIQELGGCESPRCPRGGTFPSSRGGKRGHKVHAVTRVPPPLLIPRLHFLAWAGTAFFFFLATTFISKAASARLPTRRARFPGGTVAAAASTAPAPASPCQHCAHHGPLLCCSTRRWRPLIWGRTMTIWKPLPGSRLGLLQLTGLL